MSFYKGLVVSITATILGSVYASEHMIGPLAMTQVEEECGLVFYSNEVNRQGRVFFEGSKGQALVSLEGKTVVLERNSVQAKEKTHSREYRANGVRVIVTYHVSKACKQEAMPGCEYDELEGTITVLKKKKTETISVYGHDGC